MTEPKPPQPLPEDGGSNFPSDPEIEVKGALLAGLIGAVVAAIAYVVYNRLEDQHKDTLKRSVRRFFEDKINDVRSNLKL